MTVVDLNEVAAQRLGRMRRELIGQSLSWLEPDGTADPEKLSRDFQGAIDNYPSVGWEDVAVRQPTGNVIHVERRLGAFMHQGRWLVALIDRDISRWRSALLSMERFKLALDYVLDGVALVDRETVRFLDVNAVACRRAGLTREAYLASAPYGRHSGVSREALEEIYDRVIAISPEVEVSRSVLQGPDGRTFPVESSRAAFKVDGRWVIVATARDVSEREAARRKLELFRAALDQSADALILIDRGSMTFVDANNEAVRRSGLSREAFMASVPGSPTGQPRALVEQEYDQTIAASPKTLVIERDFRIPNGAPYVAEICRTALRIDDRWMIVSASRDITHRKNIELQLREGLAELARSNAELEQFAYIASHDLSEPLRMIAGYAQLLQRRYSDRLDADGAEFIQYITAGADRMKRLIDDLLKFSRAGKRARKLHSVDMSGVARDVVENLQRLIEDKGAVIECAEMPVVLGDTTQLTQVLQNLVGNALKFSDAKAPRVAITARDAGTDWEFSVSDNGIGIEPQYFERIFVIFQRLHGRDRYEGTGIGLAICKRVVESLGGKIWVKSEAGCGSTFIFTLPKTGPVLPDLGSANR